jgi:hypothetical protein
MAKFRKKPVEIEARRVGVEGWNSIANWCGGEILKDGKKFSCILIKTLEGTMRADDGDWIIRGVNGEYYPCKPDIFEQTYEAV